MFLFSHLQNGPRIPRFKSTFSHKQHVGASINGRTPIARWMVYGPWKILFKMDDFWVPPWIGTPHLVFPDI